MDLFWSTGKVALGAAQVVYGFKKAVIVGLAGYSFGNGQASVMAWHIGKQQMEQGAKRFMEGVSEVSKNLAQSRRKQ